jgi:hypothetical protein
MQQDRRFRYTGSWVSAASALPLDGALSRPRRLVKLMAAAVRRPRRLAALFMLLLRTPKEFVVLSESRTGQALGRYLNQRRLGIHKNRFCRGVLLLPEEYPDYLRGPRRHALRTNLRRAAAAGIRCDVISDLRACDEVFAVLRQGNGLPEAELHARTNYFRGWVARQAMTVMVARDQDGVTLAVLAATIDDSVCAIGFAMATCHEARWALHDHLVRILIARRVRYLLSADEGPFGALGYPTNVLHYQHLLGYELRHMIPVAAYRAARRPRRLALAVLAACVALVAPPVAQSAMVWKSPVSATRRGPTSSPLLDRRLQSPRRVRTR